MSVSDRVVEIAAVLNASGLTAKIQILRFKPTVHAYAEGIDFYVRSKAHARRVLSFVRRSREENGKNESY